MVKKKQAAAGSEAFDAYYACLYGERWSALRSALFQEPVYESIPAPDTAVEPYYLDAGSVLAASVLPLDHARQILDMCAAPGGKSLVLASRMNAGACLCCNDRSADRRNRLVAVLDAYLPAEIRSRVSLGVNDGARMCRKQTACYDAVLLDAPCSSERHVIASPPHLAEWTAARIKNLSFTQWSLLSSAFLMLKPGGFLLYSTCSLAAAENDGVVAKLCKKYGDAEVRIPDIEAVRASSRWKKLPSPEKTQFGYHVLPDTCGGAGPLYFSLIAKSSIETLSMD